jgi:hypothetical protein
MNPARTPKAPFDLKVFLRKANGGTTNAGYRAGESIFLQGDPADAIFYIKEGRVKLTVISKQGKEAVVAILKDGDFFWGRMLGGATIANGDRRRNFGVLGDEAEEGGSGSTPPPRTVVRRNVHGASPFSEHQD